MADNTPLSDANAVVESISTDELSTQNGVDVSAASPRIKVQRIKPAYGSDSDATDVDATHGLPVNLIQKIANSRTVDSTAAAFATDALMNGLTVLTPQFAKISTSAAGATTVVAAVASKSIRVISWNLVCAGAVSVKWQSHVTPTDVTGLYPFGANGGISVDSSPFGHFQSISGEALDINLSGAVAVGGSLVYVTV